MTSRGVIYMAWGQQAIEQAKQSIQSLHVYCPGMPVLVTGDEATERAFEGDEVQTLVISTDPFKETAAAGYKFLAGRIKPLLASISPFDETLYIDADTVFKSSPECGFNMLDKWDFVVAETQTRSLNSTVAGMTESQWTAKWTKTPELLYHNSGMLFWRKNDATDKLFKLWSKEWLRFEGWDEQVALLRALLRSDVLFQTVPYVWNCRDRREAFMLHHWFGTGHARSGGKINNRSYAVPNRHASRSGIEMVQIEIAPGRTVKCYAGDEQRVIEHFKQSRSRRRNG